MVSGRKEGRKLEYPEKNRQSRDVNQQQTQTTYGVNTRNRTRATFKWEALTPVPPLLPKKHF